MKPITRNNLAHAGNRCVLAALLMPLLLPCVASAQQGDIIYPPVPSSGYSGPQTPGPDQSNGYNSAPATGPQEPADQVAPVRMVRFSYLSGPASWRPDANSAWAGASVNMPLEQGAQVWVAPGGHAELQFDDGSLMRLDSGSLVVLQTLYSDAQGEYTQIQLNSGLSALRLQNEHSLYEIDTPFDSVKAPGPASMRIGVGQVADVALNSGAATVEGPAGQAQLTAGEYLAVGPNATEYDVTTLPQPDAWDQWNTDCDQRLEQAASTVPAGALPPNVALVSNGLDAYGSWNNVPQYGEVWVPRMADPNWRPYSDGHWSWLPPFGWTWVSREPWGWAPYHYGTWIHSGFGWAWVPGPACQDWSPALVDFSTYDGNVVWCPLAPEEVVYDDSFGCGAFGLGWVNFFSIGRCAVYTHGDHGFRPRAWRSDRLNNAFASPNRGLLLSLQVNVNVRSSQPYVPRNQAFGGATLVASTAFGTRKQYRPAGAQAATFFAHGTAVAAGATLASGPLSVHPAARVAVTAGATLVVHPPAVLAARTTFHSPTNAFSQNRTSFGASAGVAVGSGGAAAAFEARRSVGAVNRPGQPGESFGATTNRTWGSNQPPAAGASQPRNWGAYTPPASRTPYQAPGPATPQVRSWYNVPSTESRTPTYSAPANGGETHSYSGTQHYSAPAASSSRQTYSNSSSSNNNSNRNNQQH